MALDPPLPGQVIRYAYLWWHEARVGREDGGYSRLVAIADSRAWSKKTYNDAISILRRAFDVGPEQREKSMQTALRAAGALHAA
jgi:two-component SAPR family response regulator